MTLAELLQARAALIKQAQALNDTAVREKRSLTAEEQAQWDKMIADAQALKDQADRTQTVEREQRDIADAEAALDQPRQRRSAADASTPAEDGERETRGGERERTPEQLRADVRREVRALARWLHTGDVVREQRAGMPWTTAVAEGGYMAPVAVVREVITKLQDLVHMLAGSRVFMLPDARAIDIPKITTQMTAAAKRTEAQAAATDAATIFGKVTLTPAPTSLEGWVANNLIGTTGGLAEDAILYEIARNMAEALETAWIAGTGSGEATGVFNETSSLTGREVHTTSQTGLGDWTDFVTALGNIRAVYRRNGAWLMHRDMVVRAMKLKDGDGRPIWLPSIVPGKPDTLLGYPIWESEFASNTFTADKRIAVFGDFSRGYGIAFTLAMRIIRLVEKYASYDGTGFVAHAYTDGKVIDDNALTALHTAV